jgi:predicted phosphodiesterase
MAITRSALLSDIHGNSPALQAVWVDILRNECSQVFVLGDIINGIDPHGCMELLQQGRENAAVKLACIKGNAEAYLLTPDLNTLPDRNEPWNSNLIKLITWFETHLSEADLEWIRTFPDFIFWNNACLVHDSPIDRLDLQSWHKPGIEPKYQEWNYHSRGIEENMGSEEWQKILAFMTAQGFTQVFCGHTHIPFLREIGNKLICNVGSVGIPCDGNPQAAWVILEERPDVKPVIKIQRVDYDITRIHQLIDVTPDYPSYQIPGFKEAYKKWFSTGILWRAHVSS